MVKNCPSCGLALVEVAAVCPLCNERLVRLNVRARHVLSALLVVEICVVVIALF